MYIDITALRVFECICVLALIGGGGTLLLFFFLDILKGAEWVALSYIEYLETKAGLKKNQEPKLPVDPSDWWEGGDDDSLRRN